MMSPWVNRTMRAPHCWWCNPSPVLLHAPASLPRCGWGWGDTKYQGLFLCYLAKAPVTWNCHTNPSGETCTLEELDKLRERPGHPTSSSQSHHPNLTAAGGAEPALSSQLQLSWAPVAPGKTRRHPTADSPGLQDPDTLVQLSSTIKELPELSAAHGEVWNLLQQEGGTAEQDKAVLSHSPACWQAADTAIFSAIFILLPGKAFLIANLNFSSFSLKPFSLSLSACVKSHSPCFS